MANRDRHHATTAYPFAVEVGAGSSPEVLKSDDGWIEYRLEQTGWVRWTDDQGGGHVDVERTVNQVALETERRADVIRLTQETLENGLWIEADSEAKLREQLKHSS